MVSLSSARRDEANDTKFSGKNFLNIFWKFSVWAGGAIARLGCCNELIATGISGIHANFPENFVGNF